VLPVYAGLCDRLGDTATAAQARSLAGELVDAVAGEWNGRWFRRAYAPCKGALGDEDCWLEVQPWAILCGAADEQRSVALLETIDELLRTNSPLGARLRWPLPERGDMTGQPGEGLSSGIWFSINMTLVWAAARHLPKLALDEWRRMTLSSHTAAYPDIWEGTLSGPDAYNSPESARPGRTWGTRQLAMQQFPVNNLHSHSQPLLSYLRLLGVEPDAGGALRAGGGASFQSPSFRIDEDGHGALDAKGDVEIISRHGTVSGRGRLEW
ncbi:MAG: GH36-type glycosyl hydrolase domain-containing protein, partial [Acidimicrobiales bacterium]